MSLTLDGTGKAVANLVTGETHPIDTSVTRVALTPSQGLFYKKGLIVTYTDADGDTRTLAAGSDYSLLYAIQDVVPGNPIYGAIVFENATLSGTLHITYQALGGLWSLHQADIRQQLQKLEFNPALAHYSLEPLIPVLNSNQDPIVLDSLAALQAVQASNPGQPIMLTVGMRLNKAGANLASSGAGQFDALKGFDPAQGLYFVIATDGQYLPIDSLPHAYTYDGSGNMLTDTVTYNGVSYVKTRTFVSNRVATETAWEPV